MADLSVALASFRVLIVPGLYGSGPLHWQSRWQRLHPEFERVEQARWDIPDLQAWSAQLEQALRRSAQPTLVIAHSFGCLATLQVARAAPGNLAGALLVAPADPARFGLARLLADVRPACRTLLVGSLNDPWMSGPDAAAWADAWGCDFVCAGQLGHINADSGLGDWPHGLELLERLAAGAAAAMPAPEAPGGGPARRQAPAALRK